MYRVLIFALLFVMPCRWLCGQHENRLPDSVVFACSIKNFDQFKTGISNTSIATYFNDPLIKNCLTITFGDQGNPLLEVIFSNKFADDLLGRVTFAILKTGAGKSQLVLISDHQSSNDASNFTGRVKEAVMSREQNARVWMRRDNRTVVIGNDQGLVEKLVQGSADGRLGELAPFQASVVASGTELPQNNFWFFVNPLAFIDQEQWKKNQFLTLARDEGMEAIRYIGGVGTLEESGVGKFVGAIVAKKPFRRGMRLLNLRNDSVKSIPGDFSSASSTGFAKLAKEKLTDSLSTVFDSLVADGEPGVFDAVLDDLKNDPAGPKIDMEKEIVGNLHATAWFCTSIQSDSPTTVVCMKLKNESIFLDALNRFYQGDEKAIKQKCDFEAWKITPLAGDGRTRNPYVVALKDGYFCISSSVAAVNNIDFNRSQESIAVSSDSVDTCCFGYQLNLQQHVRKTHRDLKQGKLRGVLSDLARQLKIKILVDNDKLPDFARLKGEFDSQLRMLGKNTEQGWKIAIAID